MKNNICCGFYEGKNTIFIDKIDEIAQKVCEILPFSKIAVLYFADEFFKFGKEIADRFSKKETKIIEIIIADNFSAEEDKFYDLLSLPEDVRGVIAFNKKLIPLICSNYLKDKTTFFVESGAGVFALKQKHYYVRDYDVLKAIPQNQRLYLIINTDSFNLDNYIKCACLYVNMLIDYIFRQKLLQEDADMQFVNKVKSILIDTLFILKDGQGLSRKRLTENLLCANELLSNKDCYYSSSPIIASFISNDDFFNLDYSFSASRILIKKYEHTLSKKQDIKVADYNEMAKALSFITRLNQNQILSALYRQVKKITIKGFGGVKEEIKKLILLYNDLAKNIKQNSVTEDNFYTQNLLLSIDLSGATPFGINGMTAFQE